MLKCVPVGLAGKSSLACGYALSAGVEIDRFNAVGIYSVGLRAVFRHGKTGCLLNCELCEAQKKESYEDTGFSHRVTEHGQV
jgi:hypothetical protein